MQSRYITNGYKFVLLSAVHDVIPPSISPEVAQAFKTCIDSGLYGVFLDRAELNSESRHGYLTFGSHRDAFERLLKTQEALVGDFPIEFNILVYPTQSHDSTGGIFTLMVPVPTSPSPYIAVLGRFKETDEAIQIFIDKVRENAAIPAGELHV